MAAGGLLFGPIGAVVAGAGFKKDREHDARELYLLVETPDFASIGEFEPRHGAQVREFTVDVNNASRAARNLIAEDEDEEVGPLAKVKALERGEDSTALLQPSHAATVSVADELAKLAALREKGVLTEEELTAQKARLLG